MTKSFTTAPRSRARVLSHDVADRLLAGENAVRVYRDHRGMTQKQLAEAAGINAIYLSQIERGRRTGSARTLVAIAEALI